MYIKKEEYSYGVIYENLKGKKEAINEIESICPCCGKDDNLKKEDRFLGKFRQTIYECDCGTKWRGNFYNENEEIVEYKDIKKANRKEKIKTFKNNLYYNIDLEGAFAIMVAIIIIIAMVFCFFAFKGTIIEKSDSEMESTKEITEENIGTLVDKNIEIPERISLDKEYSTTIKENLIQTTPNTWNKEIDLNKETIKSETLIEKISNKINSTINNSLEEQELASLDETTTITESDTTEEEKFESFETIIRFAFYLLALIFPINMILLLLNKRYY